MSVFFSKSSSHFSQVFLRSHFDSMQRLLDSQQYQNYETQTNILISCALLKCYSRANLRRLHMKLAGSRSNVIHFGSNMEWKVAKIIKPIFFMAIRVVLFEIRWSKKSVFRRFLQNIFFSSKIHYTQF